MKMTDERSLVLTTENGKTLTFEKIYDQTSLKTKIFKWNKVFCFK